MIQGSFLQPTSHTSLRQTIMGKDSRKTPNPLAIPPSNAATDIETSLSTLSLKSPKSPKSPFRFSSKLQSFGSFQSTQGPESPEKQERQALPHNPGSSSAKPIHLSSSTGGRDTQYNRDDLSRFPIKGEFSSGYTSSKASASLQPTDTSLGGVDIISRDPDRAIMTGKASGKEDENQVDKSLVRRPVVAARTLSTTTPSIHSFGTSPSSSTSNIAASSGRKGKPKPFSLLNRSKSTQSEQEVKSPSDTVPISISESSPRAQDYGSIKTAPLRPEQDRSHRDIMSTSVSRNHSADRQLANSRGNSDREAIQSSSLRNQTGLSTSQRENGGFLSGLKNSASKGVGLGRGVLGKFGRSHSTNEKDLVIDDANYVPKIINLPLVQQTRITRIAKRLEQSRDKTEFWMPAFPWRAIDYLNYRGTETEGLYRVPGSGPEIKKWQRRFDTEYDVDLFDQPDLYDINIIGSMLKSWLRELPDEILPKPIQDRVSRECGPGQEKVPQLLIDELSNLQPYNYYLLFAITCHLSLLLAHAEKNKMDFRNLCICFQPCMKIDATCFKYLVVDWAQCWKGCKTEDYWLEQEYAAFDQMPPSSEGRSSTAVESHEERNVSSSDSSQPPINGESVAEKVHAAQNENSKQPQAPSLIGGSSLSTDTSANSVDTPSNNSKTPSKATSGGDLLQPLKPLSPIEPLSPMQF